MCIPAYPNPANLNAQGKNIYSVCQIKESRGKSGNWLMLKTIGEISGKMFIALQLVDFLIC